MMLGFGHSVTHAHMDCQLDQDGGGQTTSSPEEAVLKLA